MACVGVQEGGGCSGDLQPGLWGPQGAAQRGGHGQGQRQGEAAPALGDTEDPGQRRLHRGQRGFYHIANLLTFST